MNEDTFYEHVFYLFIIIMYLFINLNILLSFLIYIFNYTVYYVFIILMYVFNDT